MILKKIHPLFVCGGGGACACVCACVHACLSVCVVCGCLCVSACKACRIGRSEVLVSTPSHVI